MRMRYHGAAISTFCDDEVGPQSVLAACKLCVNAAIC